MITGEWGCGKTHYLKHTLIPAIKTLNLEPIYVSLNGIKTKEQLQKTILTRSVLDSNKSNKKNIVNQLKKFRDGVINSLGNSRAIEPFLPFFDSSDFVQLDNPIYCVDDLERISNDYPVEEVLGYINTHLVEHKKIKVIIIGDETKNQLAETDYPKVKEKLIGWTVKYEPDMEAVCKSLFEKYSEDKIHKILAENESLILNFVNEFECKNIRTILFFLDCLEKVLSEVDIENESVLRDIIYFTFVISLEYKRGNLFRFVELKDVPQFINKSNKHNKFSSSIDDLLARGEAIEEDREGYLKQNRNNFNRYLSSDLVRVSENDIEYNYFESVYELTTNGFLDNEKLAEEIEQLSQTRKNKRTSEEAELIYRIHFRYGNNNQCFTDTYERIKEKIISGDFDLYEYAEVTLELLICHSEDLIKDSDEIEKLLIENVNKTAVHTQIAHNYKYTRLYDEFLPKIKNYSTSLKSKLQTLYETIRDSTLKQNVKLKFKDWKNYTDHENLLYLIINNISAVRIKDYIIDNIENRNFLRRIQNNMEKCYHNKSLRNPEGSRKQLSEIKRELTLLITEGKVVLIDKKFYAEPLIEKISNAIEYINQNFQETNKYKTK